MDIKEIKRFNGEDARPSSKARQQRMLKTFVYIFLAIGSFIMVVPFVWMVVTSFKPLDEINTYPPSFFIRKPTFAAYIELFSIIPMGRYFMNSLIVTSAITLANIFFCSLAGYAFAKHRFFGRDKLFLLLVGSMMIPWQVNLIPSFVIIKKFGWLNSFYGLIIPAMSGAFGIFLMRQFIMNIPDDLIDAAKIDGCSEFTIYRRVILPLIQPALASLAIFTFMGQWNNFVWPLVVIYSSKMRTIPLALSVLNGQFGTNFAMVMAGAVIATLPVLIVFIAFQKYFIKGIALTGLKA
ncbi:MAG TPA: carbohydrate ABC transporter permease [Candidatus Omnitrophota bacterium]|nr:carbohydrate ABC transporter permease [Candidatus Omnitrophota bacterium]HPN66044.1 carbohydrate ABC transporter permease [Candidatus Omnitrophota bacterium]